MSAVGGVEVIDLGFIANAALTKFRFVKGDGTGDRAVVPASVAGEAVLGVAMHDVSAGDATEGAHANVRLMGIATVEAGATVTQYGKLQTDNQGRAIDAVATVGDEEIVGIALSGGDVGEWITVLLTPGYSRNTATT